MLIKIYPHQLYSIDKQKSNHSFKSKFSGCIWTAYSSDEFFNLNKQEYLSDNRSST